MLYIIVCEVDVIANSLVLSLPFCSTLNKHFFSSSLKYIYGTISKTVNWIMYMLFIAG